MNISARVDAYALASDPFKGEYGYFDHEGWLKVRTAIDAALLEAHVEGCRVCQVMQEKTDSYCGIAEEKYR